MTDTEQTTEEVTDNSSETAVKKTTKKARKKATVKTRTTAAESISESVTAQADEPAAETASKEDKRAKLVSKLQSMGMMPGATAKAASAKTASTVGKMSAGIKSLDLTLPSWLSPQLLAVTAGAGVFAVLIWSLQQEKMAASQLAGQPVAPVYNPYVPYGGIVPPVMTYQDPAQQQRLNQANPAGQGGDPMMDPATAYPIPPGYQPYAPNYPIQAQETESGKQNTQQAKQDRSMPPAPVWQPNTYGYGYEYHPAMRFGFNGRMQGQGSGYGNGAPSYYYGPPPAYGYVPYGDPRGYGYPPPAVTQQR